MIEKLLVIFMLPLLLGATNSRLTEEDIQNNRDYYEVIGATTGKKIKNNLYAEKRVIETHIKSVKALKKALANEGINPASVRVLLYYDGLTISDSLSPRMWQNRPHPDTISSPWLDLTRTITTSGETRITVRIDAIAARLMSDLNSKFEAKSDLSNFLSIPSVKQSCYSKIKTKYDVVLKTRISPIKTIPPVQEQEVRDNFEKFDQSFKCAPDKLREPLKSLFKSSGSIMGFTFGVPHKLLKCQHEAEIFYSKIYPQITIQGLKIMENRSNLYPKWWIKIINCIQPITKC